MSLDLSSFTRLPFLVITIQPGISGQHFCVLFLFNILCFFSNLAAIHAGGFSTGIYQTNTAAACQYIADDSRSAASKTETTQTSDLFYFRANVVVVGDLVQLKKVFPIVSLLFKSITTSLSQLCSTSFPVLFLEAIIFLEAILKASSTSGLS